MRAVSPALSGDPSARPGQHSRKPPFEATGENFVVFSIADKQMNGTILEHRPGTCVSVNLTAPNLQTFGHRTVPLDERANPCAAGLRPSLNVRTTNGPLSEIGNETRNWIECRRFNRVHVHRKKQLRDAAATLLNQNHRKL